MQLRSEDHFHSKSDYVTGMRLETIPTILFEEIRKLLGSNHSGCSLVGRRHFKKISIFRTIDEFNDCDSPR